MKYRASNNHGDMQKNRQAPIGASPSHNYRFSHILNNGMKVLFEIVNALFETKFRKLYQLIIQYKS